MYGWRMPTGARHTSAIWFFCPGNFQSLEAAPSERTWKLPQWVGKVQRHVNISIDFYGRAVGGQFQSELWNWRVNKMGEVLEGISHLEELRVDVGRWDSSVCESRCGPVFHFLQQRDTREVWKHFLDLDHATVFRQVWLHPSHGVSGCTTRPTISTDTLLTCSYLQRVKGSSSCPQRQSTFPLGKLL